MSSSASVKLRYEMCLQVWGNATSEQNVQKILNLRESWTKQAIGFDMKIVEESLAKIN
jgi:hypothetical protein